MNLDLKNLILYEFIDFIKEYNVKDGKYFENININKITNIYKFYSSKYEKIKKYCEFILKYDFSFISIYEILFNNFGVKFNEYNLLKIIEEDSEKKRFYNLNRLELIYLNISTLEIERIFKLLNDFNDFNYFKKIFTELYKNKKQYLLKVLDECDLLDYLVYSYKYKNKVYINFIIDNITNKEFLNLINKSFFLFNLIVEYHHDVEFQKNIINKNIPENLLYKCLDDSITYMGGEYLTDHSFNNVMRQTIIDNIKNNNNLNILDIYKNYEINEEIKDEITKLNKEFNNFFSILLHIYNKLNFENKKNIINIIEEQDFINYLKFCCINTDNYINFINNQKKEFNWRRKSPLLLVWYFEDTSKKRKLNELKLTKMPHEMIREIINFI